jgi:hypothetical protein
MIVRDHNADRGNGAAGCRGQRFHFYRSIKPDFVSGLPAIVAMMWVRVQQGLSKLHGIAVRGVREPFLEPWIIVCYLLTFTMELSGVSIGIMRVLESPNSSP